MRTTSRGETDGSGRGIRGQGDELLGRIKELVREGNVRRVTIKNSEGKSLLEISLTIDVVGH